MQSQPVYPFIFSFDYFDSSLKIVCSLFLIVSLLDGLQKTAMVIKLCKKLCFCPYWHGSIDVRWCMRLTACWLASDIWVVIVLNLCSFLYKTINTQQAFSIPVPILFAGPYFGFLALQFPPPARGKVIKVKIVFDVISFSSYAGSFMNAILASLVFSVAGALCGPSGFTRYTWDEIIYSAR